MAASGELLVSGTFAQLGGVLNPALLRWNGGQWHPLPPSPGSTATDAPAYLTSTGEVLANGRFAQRDGTITSHVARWDGTRWQPLPNGPAELAGYSLGLAANGDLLADGEGLMRWHRTRWQALDAPQQAGIPGDPNHTEVLALASGRHDVLLAGILNWHGATSQRYQVNHWHGGRRQAVGKGFPRYVKSLAVTATGKFIAGGSFQMSGQDSMYNVARWNGQRWQRLGEGLPAPVEKLAAAPHGALLAGGSFGVARWDGRHWQNLELPFPHTAGNGYNRIRALALAPNGDILAAGTVLEEAGQEQFVARYDGQHWQLLGDGLAFEPTSLVVAADGAVVVGGLTYYHGHIYTTTTGYLAHWDGTAWHDIGPKLNGGVNALALAANGDLLIGGSFTKAGGTPHADGIARWHEGRWQALGPGLNQEVNALAAAPNGDIVVGGSFTALGDESRPMYRLAIYRDR